MRLTRLLGLVALGVAAGVYLTRTEKGRQLTSDLKDRAGDWRDKLNDLRRQTTDDLANAAEDGQDSARRTAKRASNEFA